MKISQLAEQTHVPTKTIRYYEDIGLLKPAKRAENGYRYYQVEDVQLLIFIRRCRELNMSLDEIKTLVQVQRQPNISCDTVDSMIAQQLDNVRKAQKELQKLERSLAKLAKCCTSNKIEDCKILNTLNASH
ncbi:MULTISPECIES: Cd(II)/Pb(II)-responsive transcriptional regulator [Thalassotalea]|uniref:Cd(II)/Pb(II)-responsive transcriptional regulator n=2 Tax=Pseudomonadota TaxID=1224 RepID=UPI00094354BC|nr:MULTISPECIES: Cd(II)/Pb(II)-responsive transcriptional regulator [Thalassotalea]OKY27366.1 MerR family transcriptional regulator [Thalassotalea sp. PP2-459]